LARNAETYTHGDDTMKINTIGMEHQRLLREKVNRLNAEMRYGQIVSDDDPRNALYGEVNEHMAALTETERAALLDEWGM
jgi:hypothetical protein